MVRWLAAAAVTFTGFAAQAEQVVRVKDGDSLVVASGGQQVDVRLADIDAPEYNQPHGDAARAALQALVGGREVRLGLVGGDAYRRIIANVHVDDVHVNAALVRGGHAWVRRAYDPPAPLSAAEDEAKHARRGLWAQNDPTPPWEWRRARRGSRSRAAKDSVPNLPTELPAVQCGSKRYCREMSSCAEALAFLRQCGVTTIDGDQDGVPCEKLCAPRAGAQPALRR